MFTSTWHATQPFQDSGHRVLPPSTPRCGFSRTLAVWLTVVLCTAVMALLVWQTSYGEKTDLRHADTGLPMITASDGFFYLAKAKADTLSMPLLSALTRHTADATGLTLESIAFWLPCLFTAGMAFWYVGWARLLGLSTTAAVLAAAAGSLIPAWVERSRIGWFDTDPGIAFLWHGALWATACLGLPIPAGKPNGADWTDWADSSLKISKGQKIWALVVLFLCGTTLALWWLPGAIVLPLCALLLGITFLWTDNRPQSDVRFALLLIVLLGGTVALFVPAPLIPYPLAQLRLSALDHARLIMGLKEGLIYASIAELDAVHITDYLRALGGGTAGGLISLCALLLFITTRRTAAFFLLPSLGMLVLGLMGERFLYLAALVLGLALGCLPSTIARLWEHSLVFSFIREWHKAHRTIMVARLCGLLLTCTALGNMLYFLGGWAPDGHFRTSHDAVAVQLRRASPPSAPVWNWWDDGYFLQARTGLRTLFDGGTQSPDVAFVAARPLVQENPLLARRWIRFFAVRGVQALSVLEQHWGGAEAAVLALERVLTAPDPEAVLNTLPPLPVQNPEMHNLRHWFFPQERVFLYISQRMLRISQWWMPLGQQRFPDSKAVRPHIDTISSAGLTYNTANEEMTLPKGIEERGYSTVQGAYLTDIHPLTAPWPDTQGIYLVASLQSPWLYIASGQALRSLPLRLMAPGGLLLEGFAPIAVDYGAAGAWEVLP